MTMPPPPNQPPSSPPPGSVPPPGGFGPPGSGTFGPPGTGGWPPPPPGGGPGKGRTVAGIVVAAILAVALLTAGIVFLTSGDSDGGARADRKPGTSPSSEEPTPTESESEDDTDTDPPSTDYPSDPPTDGLPTNEPSAGTSDLPLPSFLLQVGDCYDRSKKKGQVETRDCDSAHDAEVVSRKKLTGTYDTDAAVGRKADSLCRDSLRSKAREQPRGVVGGTLISYPRAKGVGAGFSYVTCSLTAGQGKKLQKPLS